MRFARSVATCIVAVVVVACGPARPVVKSTTGSTNANGDDCATAFAKANAFETAGRTRRAIRAIHALPEPCAGRVEVRERLNELVGFIAPAPPMGDETARTAARKMIVDGDAALAAGDMSAARAAWETSWATFHPNGAALARLGTLTLKTDAAAAHRYFERAASDFSAVTSEPEIDTYAGPFHASFLGADPKLLAASDGTRVTIFQDGIALAKVYGMPTRTMTLVDGELTLDHTHVDLITGRLTEDRTPTYASERSTLAIATMDQGFRFVDPKTNASLGEIAIKDARTFPPFAGGGGHVYFVPKPAVTTTSEPRAIQVQNATGWHAKLARIAVHKSTPTLVHATLQRGTIVRHTLTFACMQSEGPPQDPSVVSTSGITEKDHCDEPIAAMTSEDGRITAVQRRVSVANDLHVTSALTVTDFGAKRTDLAAPEGQTTNVVALSSDGAQLVWQFGETTRLYETKTMTVAWETTKLARVSQAMFSSSGAEILLTTPASIVTVESTTGTVRSSLPARGPIVPSAMAGSAAGFAFALSDSVAFVTAEGISYVPTSTPIDSLRPSPRADRVVALAAGRPPIVVSRAGSVAKLVPTSVADAAFSSDGTKLFVANGDAIELHDAATGALVSTVTKIGASIRSFLSLEDRIVIASGDELSTYDLKTKSTTSINLGSRILQLAASPDQSVLLALTIDEKGSRIVDVTGRPRVSVALQTPARDLVVYSDHFIMTVGARILGFSLATGRAVEPDLDITFLPGKQAMITTRAGIELLSGTPTCHAGSIFVPLEVCDGLLTEGTLARLLTPTR